MVYESRQEALQCVMPWKALYMDVCDGRICALPCCQCWVKGNYGAIGSGSLQELWNSEGAQHIRRMIASGRQREICNPNCMYWMSGKFGETSLRILDGSPKFVENQKISQGEIQRRETVLHSHPMLLKIVTSLHCNLRCSMCFQDHSNTSSLDENTWKEIEQLLPYTHEIIFQGGEATLDSSFRSFINSTTLQSNQHVRVGLITNGTTMGESLLEGLRHVKLNSINVSINAATPETYAKITGKNFFERVIDNVRKLSELTHHRHQGDFVLFLSFVVMRSNFHELPQFLRLANDLRTKIQLLDVVGNENGEDIFVRTDQHEALLRVLDQASHISTGMAKEQVDRIRIILDSYRLPKAANEKERSQKS